MNTREEIEAALEEIKKTAKFKVVAAEVDRLLRILVHIEEDITALVILAMKNSE